MSKYSAPKSENLSINWNMGLFIAFSSSTIYDSLTDLANSSRSSLAVLDCRS